MSEFHRLKKTGKSKVAKLTEDVDVSEKREELTDTAYDLVYNPATKKYHMVKVNYDLNTGKAEVVSSEAFTGSQAIALNAINEVHMKKVLTYSRRKK